MSGYLYLHGFASGPASRKAQFFRSKLAAEGIALAAPDLTEGNFEGLTLTAQLAVIEKLQPRVLIGSSLGGYLASLHAARSTKVERVVLLAPAFAFAERLLPQLFGVAGLEHWRNRRSAPVFHYATGREEHIGYQLLEDARKYDPFPGASQPTLIFHGVNDTVVPIAFSREFTDAHANAVLHPVDSGHELLNALDEIWAASRDFLLA